MPYSLRLILSAILFLSLFQSGQAKTSTENLIVKESDILEFKKSTEIEEGDFFEDVQTNSEKYVWVVNLKNGPFSTQENANQAALKLKKIETMSDHTPSDESLGGISVYYLGIIV